MILFLRVLLFIYFFYFCQMFLRGSSNEYPQSMFWAEIRKIKYTPVNLSFTI